MFGGTLTTEAGLGHPQRCKEKGPNGDGAELRQEGRKVLHCVLEENRLGLH